MPTSPTSANLPLPAPFHHTQPRPSLVSQGAEGHLLKTVFLDPAQPAALKVRPSKPYRHQVLDQRLTKQRVLAEARVLVKLGNLGLPVPAVFGVNWRTEERPTGVDGNGTTAVIAADNGTSRRGEGAWLLMEWIEGTSVRKSLEERDRLEKAGLASADTMSEEDVRQLLRRIGWTVGKMHSVGGVVHGDLTSSNIMVRSEKQTRVDPDVLVHEQDLETSLRGEVVLIDFGLASQSIQDEDRAVDLYVLERAFGSTHPNQEIIFAQEVLDSEEGYKGSFKGSKTVLKRLEEVRLRGRKRSMLG